MRLARLRDYQRYLIEKDGDWRLRLRRFQFENVPSLGSGEFAFASPLTILCGPNGVGKTTLLRAIWATASPQSYVATPGTNLKLGGGRATLDLSWNGSEESYSVQFPVSLPEGEEAQGLRDIEVLHLDSADRPAAFQERFCALGDFDEITNGVGANELTERQLNDVRSLCARNYRSVTLYEVEDGDQYTPFFDVAYGDDRYDTRTMGSGEAAALYLWWALDRISENALVLIEEPETYLSPASQEGLIHHLTQILWQKKVTAIVTSHSAKIIQSVPDRHQTYIHRERGRVRVDSGGVSPEFLEQIGIYSPVESVLMVEDEAARMFAQLLLGSLRPELARRCETLNMGGHGDISILLRKTKDRSKVIRFVGLYDGDQRGAVPNELLPLAAFLPGNKPVEAMFKELLESETDKAKTAFGEDRLGQILSSLEGKDLHDWFPLLAKGLSLGVDQLFLMLFQFWKRQPGAEEAANSCVSEIEEALGLTQTSEQATSPSSAVTDSVPGPSAEEAADAVEAPLISDAETDTSS